MKTSTFFSIVDSKRGKIWINVPRSNKAKLVADIKDNIDHYFKWIEIIEKIRNGSSEQIADIVRIIENVTKNFKI